ncbi:hypothetical protein OM427_28120 [Halomonas sp. 18H]|uniref:hypothetical protein n=1 Tax=Halomonas almeriensis TaxID=308163 RepID=UPI0022312C9A|nr:MULTISPECIES: hypothetical protein [Halomonas]MCW4153381.1 hypothetical protein [Halomonas sp. 18H]MDN3553808.1 hypothetical protein [Halomonas almeriensis]
MFTWDIGMKRGRVRLLGLLFYATPLCSILVLIAFDLATPSPSLLVAALLICGGALIGSGMLGGPVSQRRKTAAA